MVSQLFPSLKSILTLNLPRYVEPALIKRCNSLGLAVLAHHSVSVSEIMRSPIEILPLELFIHVTTFLRHDDLAKLLCVSRRYQQLVEPILWRKIEFHAPNYHEKSAYGETWKEVTERPYQVIEDLAGESTSYRNNGYRTKAMSFFQILGPDSVIKPQRRAYLTGLVRWLCIQLAREDSEELERNVCLEVLMAFPNLEYFEIDVYWWTAKENVVPFRLGNSAQPMEKLHTAKLKGYLPAEFVQYVCRHAATITTLELGVLDEPIGANLVPLRFNPPPVLPDVPEEYEGMTDEEIEALDEREEFDEGEIAPRPLLSLHPNTIAQFTNLAHLRLIKPAQDQDEDSHWIQTYFSVPSEVQCLKMWAELLRIARPSLEVLILDQRVCVESRELDRTSAEEFMFWRLHGPSYHRFVDIVLPVLLEGGWPKLKQIHLYGFEVPDDMKTQIEGDQDEFTSPGSVDMVGRLREILNGVEIQVTVGRRMLFDRDSGEVKSYDIGSALDSYDNFPGCLTA